MMRPGADVGTVVNRLGRESPGGAAMAISVNRFSMAVGGKTGDERDGARFLVGAHARHLGADAEQASRDELLRHHAALLDAQREQRELTELIVHDLKAPLMALRTGLEWMRGHLWPG